MRQILSFVFVGLFAGCHGSENPVVSPDDAAGDAMASDSSANAAKMTVSAGTAGGGSNRQVPRSHKARELVSATTNAGGLTLSSGTAGGLHSEKLLVETTFWEDGTLRLEYHYYLHPETNDQIREGWAINYSKSGELFSKGKHKDDEKHGLWVGYRWGGKVWNETEFSHGTLVGRDFTYFENGQVSIERHYVGGEKEGKEVYYYDNGQVSRERHYVDGKLDGKWVEYDEEGNITDEDIYRDDECVELCEERD